MSEQGEIAVGPIWDITIPSRGAAGEMRARDQGGRYGLPSPRGYGGAGRYEGAQDNSARWSGRE